MVRLLVVELAGACGMEQCEWISGWWGPGDHPRYEQKEADQ
jgi:hypothetical protein